MTEKPHTRIVVGAGILALALEGWQAIAGETLSHTIGLSKAGLGVVAAVAFGWIYAVVYDYANPPKRAAPKRRARSPKSH